MKNRLSYKSVYYLMNELLLFINDSYSEKENNYYREKSGNYDYILSDKMYDDIYKINDTPYIQGLEDDNDYENFFFGNWDYIVEYLEELSQNIYDDFNIKQFKMTPQQFYRGLYYDNDTGKTYPEVFKVISKIIVKRILSEVIYLIDNPEN